MLLFLFVVPEISSALSLSPEAFESKYGYPKPGQADFIVTHCKVGGRAAKGADALRDAGFQKVSVYSGSMEDWKRQGGEVVSGEGATSSRTCSMI